MIGSRVIRRSSVTEGNNAVILLPRATRIGALQVAFLVGRYVSSGYLRTGADSYAIRSGRIGTCLVTEGDTVRTLCAVIFIVRRCQFGITNAGIYGFCRIGILSRRNGLQRCINVAGRRPRVRVDSIQLRRRGHKIRVSLFDACYGSLHVI